MPRRDLERHLLDHGCRFVGEAATMPNGVDRPAGRQRCRVTRRFSRARYARFAGSSKFRLRTRSLERAQGCRQWL